jgi:hypothetical protein
MQVYQEIFKLVAAAYRICVRVLVYRQIVPKLKEWGQTISSHCGCDDNVIFLLMVSPGGCLSLEEAEVLEISVHQLGVET